MSRARLALFTLVEWSFGTACEWALSAGHEIALVVTLTERAGGALRPSTIAGVDPPVLVVPTLAGCVPALAEADLDLGVVFTFSRVPESVAALPRCGMVNLHPSLLPAFRGPNAYSALYAGAPEIGATLHRLTARLDSGHTLALAAEPTPRDVTPDSARAAMRRVATAVLERGVPRALAGEQGEPQDDAIATRARPFSDSDHVLGLDLDAQLFQCRFSALMLAGAQPLVALEGEVQPLLAVRRLDGPPAGAPGLIGRRGRRATVAVADGTLELALGRLLSSQ